MNNDDDISSPVGAWMEKLKRAPMEEFHRYLDEEKDKRILQENEKEFLEYIKAKREYDATPTAKGSKKGSVTFDADTGNVWLGNDLVGTLKPNKKNRRYYDFFQLLFVAATHTLSFETIYNELTDRKKRPDMTYEQYCYDLKSKIKKSPIPRIDELIFEGVDRQGKAGYRLEIKK